MNLQQLLSTELASRLGRSLAHSIWEGAIVAGALWVVMSVLRRRSPQMRYLACTSAMALVLLGGAVTFCRVTLPASPASIVAESPSTPAIYAARPFGADVQESSAVPAERPHVFRMPSAPAARADSAAPKSSRYVDRLQAAMPWAVGAWVAGVILLSLWNLCGWIAAQRLKSLGTRCVSAELSTAAESLAQRLRLTKPVLILQSIVAETPVVIGWLRPVVLLPASVLTGLTPAQLDAVLAHELAHIRRHDYLVNLFQVVVETLLFYHPAVWWISRRMRLEREQCCDDVAVSVCGDRCAYVESLAALEEVRLAGTLALAASGSGGSQLLLRVKRLLGFRDDSPRQVAGAMTAGGVLLLAALALAGICGNSARTRAGERPDSNRVAIDKVPASQPATWDPPRGLEFLKTVPELRGIFLTIPEQEFQEMVKSRRLMVQKSRDDDGDISYHVSTDAGENVIVMFNKDGACRGIQRLKPTPVTQPATSRRAAPLPPATQPDAASVPRLEFRLVAEPGDESDADEMTDGGNAQHLRVLKRVELDERDVSRAYPMKLQGAGQAVGVDFIEPGEKKFEAFTAANVHRRLAIVLKGQLLSAPKIQTKISKSAVITSGADGFTDRQVLALVESINALIKSAPGAQPATAPAARAAEAIDPDVRPQGEKAKLLHAALTDLSRDYALKDGEVMRIIKPPFPKARSLAIEQNYGVTAEDAEKVRCVCFNWKDGIATPGAWYKQDASLESLYPAFIEMPWSGFDVDALRAFKWPGLHGDLIIRDDATPEEKLKAFASLIEQETNTRVEMTHKKVARTCVVLHGGTDLPGYAYVNPEPDTTRTHLGRLIEERELILNELAGYAARRDRLVRDLDEGRTPPDIEQHIHDTVTYTQFRQEVVNLDIELKKLRQFNGPNNAQVINMERMRDAWQATVDAEHEKLKKALSEGLKAAFDSEISASVSNLARIDQFIKQADGKPVASEPKSNVEGRGGFAVFITAEPLDDAKLSRWAKRLTLYGSMGRPDGMGMFFGPESASYNIGAPFIVDPSNNGQFWRTNLFLLGADVAGWRPDEPGYTEKLTRVLDNLKKQVGGDWRIEQREFDVLSLQAVPR